MNQFGKISRLELTAALSRGGKTFLQDSFFTSPFKVMKPFESGGAITVFQQSASAGILAGDAAVRIADNEYGIKRIAGRLENPGRKEQRNGRRQGISQDFKYKKHEGETDILNRLPFFR